MPLIAAYLVTGAAFLALDLLWLGVIAHDLYRREMAAIIAPAFNIGAAVAFYLIYIAGICYFVIRPALAEGEWRSAAINGALLGFLCYATYDLTGWAVIRDWPGRLALIDMAWGTFLTATAATLGTLAAMRVGTRKPA